MPWICHHPIFGGFDLSLDCKTILLQLYWLIGSLWRFVVRIVAYDRKWLPNVSEMLPNGVEFEELGDDLPITDVVFLCHVIVRCRAVASVRLSSLDPATCHFRAKES